MRRFPPPAQAYVAAAGAAPTLFPPLLLPHQQAGQVLSGCDCGYLPGTPVFAGIGDAGALLRASVPGSHGVFFLPYLNGERFPVLDPDIRGAYLGLTPETAPADLARAALEGVAFSLRQGLDQLDAAPSGADTISLIGGGSQEPDDGAEQKTDRDANNGREDRLPEICRNG